MLSGTRRGLSSFFRQSQRLFGWGHFLLSRTTRMPIGKGSIVSERPLFQPRLILALFFDGPLALIGRTPSGTVLIGRFQILKQSRYVLCRDT